MHRGFGTERIEDDIKLIFPRGESRPDGFGYHSYPYRIRENYRGF